MQRANGHYRHLALASLVLMAHHASPLAATPKQARSGENCTVRAADVSLFRDNGLGILLDGRLRAHPLLLDEKIDVRVSGGVATLSGSVSAPSLILVADRTAADTDGIRCIRNHLTVAPPPARSSPPD